MIKGLFRFVAFLLLAAGFVGTVMDAARSLANSSLDYARLGDTVQRVLGDRVLQVQAAIERNIHPLLWDPVMSSLLLVPTSLLLLALGLGCYRIGRREPQTIGYVTRN